jgi:thiamine kinase-like enzyme
LITANGACWKIAVGGFYYFDGGIFYMKETLITVLCTMLGKTVTDATYQTRQLHGGSVGNAILITGEAKTADSGPIPYRVVKKTIKKWERYADPHSWRREYDLYLSELGKHFSPSLRWPVCYHAECGENEAHLWLEYIGGTSGLAMDADMYERATYELGRFQGKLYAEQPKELKTLTNLSQPDAMEKFYYHYKSWDVVYDYIRSADCGIPPYLCRMLTEADENAEEIFRRIRQLPVVFCHRDFWVTNIFCCGGDIVLIDWDTTGWGYLAEDIVSLIADEADVPNMVALYNRCVPAYRQGFSQYADISGFENLYVWERMVLHFGYRLIEWYLNAETPENKKQHLDTLQKIYEMKGSGK